MTRMVPYYRVKLSGFFDLGMSDWKAAAVLEPMAKSPLEDAALTYWCGRWPTDICAD